MAETREKPPRPPNPACANCRHPRSFHHREQEDGSRPCNAFGCQCGNYEQAED